MDLQADFSFARENQGSEFKGMAQELRYVAAINPDCTRAEFVKAAVEFGHVKATAERSFAYSRRFDADSYGYQIDNEGRLIGW